ncbi:MAG: RES family NAD+ phosphorylase [Flavobacteriaceae bacterium]|nr:RES family NAD+ phosphorylase [Flavobacteriaceae bacterium]
MQVYRLSKEKYADQLSGIGASKSGNRWNSKGTEIIYCASSRALAMAEVSVHISLTALPKDFVMMEIFIPDFIKIQSVGENDLFDRWNDFPHNYRTQKIGDFFIMKNEYCILKVPSAVVKGDFNYLLNPYHVDFKKVKIMNFYKFPFDARFFS